MKLHTRLGKPIPATDPVVVKKPEQPAKTAAKPVATSSEGGEATEMDTSEPDIEPVGQDYIEELKSDDGKLKKFISRVNSNAMMKFTSRLEV